MKNYDLKKIKKAAKGIVKENYPVIAFISALSMIIFVVTDVLTVLLAKNMVASGLMSLVMVCLMGPVTIGSLVLYQRIIMKKPVGKTYIFQWYTQPKKLLDALKTWFYYLGTMLMWVMTYVGFPLAMVYFIWGGSLVGDDQLMNYARSAIILTATILVASLPCFIHVIRYNGGLYMTAQETHLNVRMRFEIGKDFLKPHIYKYSVVFLSFILYFLIFSLPYVFTLLYSTQLGMWASLINYVAYGFSAFVVMPYFTITSLLFFMTTQKGGNDKQKSKKK